MVTAGLPKQDALMGDNYHITLNQSMQNLLGEIHRGSQNFSHLINIFYQLMQAKIDPPLESIWFYSALSFCSHRSPDEDTLNRISETKGLFHLISTCSGSCNPIKSVALLAPVVLHLYKLVLELQGKNLSSKRERKAMREAKSLIEGILGCISLCGNMKLTEGKTGADLSLIMPVADLVRVWTEGNEGLESFFPLVSGKIHSKISGDDCDVNYLAGAVILEAFLLKLCLDFRGEVARTYLEELKSWAVGSITGFRNLYFFDILVSMLLESSLPVTSLLGSENVVQLKKVLYDAVILVEYSFLNPKMDINQPVEFMKDLAIKRLIITQEGIKCAREDGDQKRALSYTSSFSNSRLSSQLMKWFQTGESWKNGSSPKAFIQWLLDLERQSIKVFGDSLLKHHARLAIDNSRADYKQKLSNGEVKEIDADILFYIDDEGEGTDREEDETRSETISSAFITAARSMKWKENKRRKREETGGAEKKERVKYDLGYGYDTPSGRFSDDPNSESEVDDPVSD